VRHLNLANQTQQRIQRKKLALSILLLFVLGSLLNIPFSRAVKRLNLEAGRTDVTLNESIFQDIPPVLISSLIIGVVLIYLGLWVSARAQLGAPLLAGFFTKEATEKRLKVGDILQSIAISSVAAIVLLGLFKLQRAYLPVDEIMARPAKSFYILVSFSAGITEEIIFRLGLMSLIVAGVQFLKRSEFRSGKTIWFSIIISGLFFGLIHLPLSKNFVELTPFTVGVTMVGNLITGSIFGWIFWKRGLLVAILCHIISDLVFHVLGNPYG